MRSFLIPISIACATLALAGCAITDEGAIEIRRFVPEQKVDGSTVPATWCLTCEEENDPGARTVGSYSGGVAIPEDTTVSISLRTIVVHDMSESMSLGPSAMRRALKKKNKEGWQPKQEVAILANVIEASRKSDTSDKELGEGRVIYYSDDVLDGQRLNQYNVPVYGPIPYKGGSLFVRFSIYEVDAEDTQVAGVLSALADAGGRAFPSVSPILGVLNRVGASFAKGAGPGSDRHFDYRMVFDANAGSGNVRTFTLRTGDYVMLRSENRSAKFDWKNLVYDTKSGLLVRSDCNLSDDTIDCAYRDDSYVVFTINSGQPISGFDYQTQLSDLEKQLGEANEAKARVAILESFVGQATAAANFDAASAALTAVGDAKRPARARLEDALKLVNILGMSRCAGEAYLGVGREEIVIERLRALANPGGDTASEAVVAKLWPSELNSLLGVSGTGAACTADGGKKSILAQAVTKGFVDPPAPPPVIVQTPAPAPVQAQAGAAAAGG